MKHVLRRALITPLLAVSLALGFAVITQTPAFAAGFTITTLTLSGGTVGGNTLQNIQTSGGTSPITFAVTTGSLPPGISLGSSSGTVSGQFTAAGTFPFTVTATDANNNTAQQAYSMTVAKATTNTNEGTSPGQSSVGQLVTYQATVGGTGNTPTGTVTFTSTPGGSLPGGVLCTATIPQGGGLAQCSTNSTPGPASPNTPGQFQTDQVTATYNGDSNFLTSTNNTATETVNAAEPSATAVTAAPTSSTFGQSVTYNVTVTSGAGTPTGNATVTSGSVTLCTASLTNGTGSCAAGGAPAGSDTITATYNGVWTNTFTSSFVGSSGTTIETVTPANTTSSAQVSPTSSTFGQSVQYQATVSSANAVPTGTVSFTIGAVNLCTTSALAPAVGNSANGSCTATNAPAGPDTVTATYSGSANFNSSNAATPLTVAKASTTTVISATPSSQSFGSSVSYSATISVTAPGGTQPGQPAGTVTFTTNGGATTLCQATITSGSGSCPATNAPVGTDTITGTYSGTTSYNGSSNTTTETVSQAVTNVAASAAPGSVALGNSVTYKAVVTSTGGTPTGSVSFVILVNSVPTSLCASPSPLVGTTATCVSSTAPVGAGQAVFAAYGGDTNFQAGSGVTSVTVTKGVTNTAIQVAPTSDDFNQQVTYSATVTSPGTSVVGLTGTVAFTTSGGSVQLCTATLSSGQGSCTSQIAPIGNDTINGQYSGDSNFLTSSGNTPLDVINQASTTTTAQVSSPSVELDQSVTYTATVSTTPPGTITGSVQFTVGSTVVCSANVGASNMASCASSAALLGSGQTVTAAYQGNINFGGSNGTTTLSVTTDNTTTAVSPSPTSGPFGSSITYTATVTNTVAGGPTPTGSVPITIGSTNLCMVNLTNGSGSCMATNAPTGSDTVTATYGGDANSGSSLGTSPLTINKAPTVTAPGLSANSVVFGTSVTYSATVTPTPAGTPSGTVTFTVGATTLCMVTLSSGSGSCMAVNAPVGSDSVKATYSGDTNFATSNATIALTVSLATTTTTPNVSAPSVTFGTSVTYSATVMSTGGTPTGSVSFKDGATSLCTATLTTGAGSCNATDAPLGTDTITATYSGDSSFAGSSQTIGLTVTQANTVTTPTVSAPNPPFGSQVTYSVTVTSAGGTPTGSVAFTIGALNLCTANLTAGAGSCKATTAPTGSDTVTATYSGDTNFMNSMNTVPLNVVQATVTVGPSVSQSPVQTGTNVTYSVTVTSTGGIPTGTVDFAIGMTDLCTTAALVNGSGSCMSTLAPIGNPNTVTATYSGDTNFASGMGTTSLVVTKLLTTTAITVPSTSPFDGSVTYSATVNPVTVGGPTPTGSVVFTAGVTSLCTATLSGGSGSCSSSAAPIGVDTVTGTYGGDTTYAGSSQNSQLTVNQDSTTTAISVLPTSVTFGASVSYSALVTNNVGGAPTPTGSVTFTTGSNPVVTLCTANLTSGSGSCSATTAPGGSDTITGTFSGDTDTATSIGTTTLTVSKASTTVAPVAGSGTAVFGQTVTYSATVTSGAGKPTGTVAFTIGALSLCTTPAINQATGIGSCTAASAPVGNQTVNAVYSGDTNFSTSSQITGLNVSKASTTAALNATPNPVVFSSSVAYTATISVNAPGSGSPGGTVAFTSNGNGIAGCGAVNVSALTATCNVSNAPSPGTYSIVATYTPGSTDAPNYNGSTSTTVHETVNPAPTTTTASVNPTAVVTGGSVAYSATVSSSVASPTGTVTFMIGSTTLCVTGALTGGAGNSASGSCNATNAAESPNDAVVANYSGNTNLSPSSSSAMTLSVGPNAPAPPTDASASNGAPSPSPTGSATAKVATNSATGNGYGALTLSTLSGNPETAQVPQGTGAFDQVSFDPASQYGSVQLSICGLASGHSLDWWNGTAWIPLAGQNFSLSSGCITDTLNSTSTPALPGLTTLLLAVSLRQGPEFGNGYWLTSTDGGIFGFGDAAFFGSTGGIHLNKPIVGMAPTPDSGGYWLVASDGGIFSFGDATFHGSTGAIHLNQPIVGMASTPDGGGYWLVASDGGIFAFGDATFFGSTGAIHLNKPIVGMATTPDGRGYWLVATDGGIFAFGDAVFHGSTGAIHLNQPIVGMAPTADGGGYWLVASDGGIFAFGNASFHGSTGAIHLNQPIVGMAATPDGGGYWLVAADGGIFNFGDAPFDGSAGSSHLNSPIVTMASG